MQPTLTFQVRPALPKALEPLAKMVGNIWFAWNPDCVALFNRMDRNLWKQARHNPVAFLNQLPQPRLEALARDAGFVAQLERVAEDLDTYMGAQGCPFLGRRAPQRFQVAYFSAEYGLSDCLPIYSGGLGMLSGDHLKSASDLNLPLVGVGLAYGQGYFTQYLNPDGWQMEKYVPNDFHNMPMELVTAEDGSELRVEVDIEGQNLIARVWKVQVGRVPLYLMDANIDENTSELRSITYQLYGGDRTMRIRQEILLGIGGVRLLKALGIQATVYHMNEGHSAFASLERIRQLRMENGLSFDEAREVVKTSNVFTTHTPVPAGNDYFEPELVQRHFGGYVRDLGLSLPVLMGYGRIHPTDQSEHFCMTVLALRLSSYANGVSKLHGEVSRSMWQEVWPHFPLEDVPISHVTNGVHITSYLSQDLNYLFSRYLGMGWMENPDSQAVWAEVDEVPDAELWRVHEMRRSRTVAMVRRALRAQLERQGASSQEIQRAAQVLSSDHLTIVFARRFATYKRAILLLKDLERLASIVNHPQRPVQFIFAGKAHPLDNEGKEFIRQVFGLTKDPRFHDKVVFLENYDINLARYLVQGADVWLNNPRRPLEACGTSGMKASANGALNLSIMDGWWDEAYEPGIGWAIGRGEEYKDEKVQDDVEAGEIYRLLEGEVSRLFYERDEHDLPRGWINYMKRNLAKVCPNFNSHRMVEDYTDQAYLPAAEAYLDLTNQEFGGAKELGGWVRKVMEHWSQVQVVDIKGDAPTPLFWGQQIEVTARVRLGGLSPEDLSCDLYYGALGADGQFRERLTAPMEAVEEVDGIHRFVGKVQCEHSGRLGLKVRVVPNHRLMLSKYSLGLAAWG